MGCLPSRGASLMARTFLLDMSVNYFEHEEQERTLASIPELEFMHASSCLLGNYLSAQCCLAQVVGGMACAGFIALLDTSAYTLELA
jgi:hypothetical protein